MDTVFKALVSGLNGTPLTNPVSPLQATLTADSGHVNIEKISEAQLPYLLLKSGSLSLSEWVMFEYQVSWDIEGQLKIKSEPAKADAVMQSVMEDLLSQVTKLHGLFVDDSYVVHPLSMQSLQMYQQGLLTPLAMRGGPFVRSFRMRPQPSESAFMVADLTIHLEFISQKEPELIDPAFRGVPLETFSVGTIFRNPDSSIPLADPYQDFKYQLPRTAYPQDVQRQGRYSTPDQGAPRGARSSPPFNGQPIVGTAGVPYSDLVKEINVSPASATFAHTGTQQLTALAIHTGGWGEQITANPSTTWVSSNQTIATVSASGLVSGVAAGSCTITCSFGGASGTSSLTLT